MSVSPDNELLRDAGLTAAYREAAQDAPPPALDAAIIAAARREVGARPRAAGRSYVRAWRAPLSIAAVIVLSVSLVTLMREEAPDLVAPPRADAPTAETRLESPIRADGNAVTAEERMLRGEQQSKSIGLKPSSPASQFGLGMRPPEYVERSALPNKDDMADRRGADATGEANLAKRRIAASAAADTRDNKPAATTEPSRQAGKLDAQRDLAPSPAVSPLRADTGNPSPAGASVAGAMVGNKAQGKLENATTERAEPESHLPAPARQMAGAPPASATMAPPPAPVAEARTAPAGVPDQLERSGNLAPEKWLERIEELRKRGRLDEAKASLAEFRKRYPDYRLPDGLREWVTP